MAAVTQSKEDSISRSKEMLAFCPECGCYSVLIFNSCGNIATPQFTKEKGEIYHNCGANDPCRLLVRFLRNE